jgi:hypothetical protein
MPAKRKPSKSRLGIAVRAEAWAEIFSSGDDFFNDLADIGISDDEAKREALPEAWQSLGPYFLQNLWPSLAPLERRATPWAVEKFGYPKGAAK